jgi:thiol-disulfide isomerase/thioredoxin
LITSLTDKLWEKRLYGDAIWLVEFYAPWCPGCRNFRPQFKRSAGELTAPSAVVDLDLYNY